MQNVPIDLKQFEDISYYSQLFAIVEDNHNFIPGEQFVLKAFDQLTRSFKRKEILPYRLGLDEWSTTNEADAESLLVTVKKVVHTNKANLAIQNSIKNGESETFSIAAQILKLVRQKFKSDYLPTGYVVISLEEHGR